MLHTNSENEQVRKDDCENEIRDEVTALREQIAQMQLQMACMNTHKTQNQYTSTPQRQNEKISESGEIEQSSGITKGHVHSHFEMTQYLSADEQMNIASGSESFDSQIEKSKQTKNNNMSSADILVQMRKLQEDYDRQQMGERNQQTQVVFCAFGVDSKTNIANSRYQQVPDNEGRPASVIHMGYPLLQQCDQQQRRPYIQQQPQQWSQQQQQQQQRTAQQPQQWAQQQQQHYSYPQYQDQQIHFQQRVDPDRSVLSLLSRQNSKDLPRFDGNPDEWLLFSTQYWRTTRSCNFSSDENLLRLQICLHGPAREAVKALLVLPQCVDEIMQTLYARFDRDEFVIKNLISKTRRVVAPKEDQPQTIIEFATVVNNMVVTVRNLGRVDYLENPQLLEHIESKLPPMLSMLWSNAIINMQRYTICDLSVWLNQQSRALSLRVLPKDEKRKPQVHKVFAASESLPTPVTPTETVSCVCCKKRFDSLTKCPEFIKLSVDKRVQLLKKSFACFSCLYLGHTSARCRRRLRCEVEGCNGRHHTLLHMKKSVNVSQTKDYKPTDSSSDEMEVCATIPSAEKSVLLKVIPVTIRIGDT